MKQIVDEIVVFLNLMGYDDRNSKIRLLTNMYNNQLDMEKDAIINILESLIAELNKNNVHESIIANLDNYITLINRESEY